MAAQSRATAQWSGTLFEGKGSVTPSSGAFQELPLTWEGRTTRPEGSSSPEELIASAHASCLSMALSNELAKGGHPADQLEVSATATADKTDEGLRILSMRLEVTGSVPGLDADGFDSAVQAATKGCPVSNALKGNVDISATSTLK